MGFGDLGEIYARVSISTQDYKTSDNSLKHNTTKIIEEQNWNIGQILELTYNKKTYVKLWPASPEEYGASLIKIDGITRQNIGAGLDDKISIKSVEAANAEEITLSPTEKITIDGLQEYMIYNYLNHVFSNGDSITSIFSFNRR